MDTSNGEYAHYPYPDEYMTNRSATSNNGQFNNVSITNQGEQTPHQQYSMPNKQQHRHSRIESECKLEFNILITNWFFLNSKFHSKVPISLILNTFGQDFYSCLQIHISVMSAETPIPITWTTTITVNNPNNTFSNSNIINSKIRSKLVTRKTL